MKLTENTIKRFLSYYLRKKINKKIVIFESDDWGLERSKNEIALDSTIKKYGYENISRWTKDSLETVEDLNLIYTLFDNYKEKFIKKPIITANFITHNIDFSSKTELKFKPISEGYNFADNTLFLKYKEGLEKQYFKPQLHGFSHYNTELLHSFFHTNNFQEDFDIGFPFAQSTIKGSFSVFRAECFDPNFQKNFQTAMNVFEKTFGYKSETFIPPNYLYDFNLNKFLKQNGINQLQSGSFLINQKQKNTIAPYFRTKNGIVSSVRCSRLDTHSDYNYLHENCIKQIEFCFSKKIPAIIDIHRVNFSGKFAIDTRQKTIEELDKVLLYLSIKHPDVVFISSDQLLQYLIN